MNEHDKNQPLVQHLLELRSCVLKSIVSILVVFIGIYALGLANTIYTFVAQPLQKFLPTDQGMIATEVASTFLAPMKLSLFTSVFICMPYILFQLWTFIAPALYKNEKKIALPLFTSSVVLFYAGMAFAYFVVFPLVFGFFTAIAPEGVEVMTDINAYLSFVLKLFFAFGLAFEIPVATVLLISAGIISPKGLAKKRPYVVVFCFIVGMFLTPPDVFSQLLLALPMWTLFELGLIFGKFVKPQEQEEKEEEHTIDPSA